ncbi:MAG: DUF6220 domain-containing protein [Nitrolancea sp.]
MSNVISKLHAGLSVLTLLAVILQFFLAGLGVFGAEPYDAHETNGYLIAVSALLLLILGLIGRLNRERLGTSAGLLVLMILQIALIESKKPWIEAFHPLVALLILGASFQLALRGRASLGGSRDRATRSDAGEPRVSPGR